MQTTNFHGDSSWMLLPFAGTSVSATLYNIRITSSYATCTFTATTATAGWEGGGKGGWLGPTKGLLRR